MNQGAMQTYTGRLLPRLVEPEHVCIEDIAHALAHTSANPHYRDYYSLAERSILASQFVAPEHARVAFLAEASRAYDIDGKRRTSPAWAVLDQFRLSEELTVWRDVRGVLARVLVDEALALSAAVPPWLADVEPLGAEILCYSPAYAEVMFMMRYYTLYPERLP